MKRHLFNIRHVFLIITFLFTSHLAFAQVINVGGVVSDKSGPLVGVSIGVDGTTIGTLSDVNGKYSINVPSPQSNLRFSYIGYNSVIELVGNRTIINVQLTETAYDLDEVVVIGYGTSRIKDLTSAVTSVKTAELDKSGVDANIDMMLLGRIPGLNMNIQSAQPGARVDVNIRGRISPNGNNAPLYVVDGVALTANTANIGSVAGSGDVPIQTGLDQSPLNTINPNDIESINILKDASAAAIYGSAAANGVIIITTKRGSSGGLKVSYEGSHTLSYRKPYRDNLYDAKSFMTQQNRFYRERQAVTNNVYPYRSSSGYTDYNKDGQFNIDDYTAAFNSVSDQYSIDEIASAKNFNWLDYIVDDAWVAEHNLSLSGGNEKTKYFASYNYHHNDGLLKNSNMGRNSFRFNFDQNLAKWLDFGVTFNYSLINTDNTSSGDIMAGSGVGTLVTGAISMTPYIEPVIDPSTGKYMKGLNEQLSSPAGLLTYLDNTKNQRLFISPTLTFKIAKGLTFKAVQGYDSQFSRRDHYIPIISGQYNAPEGMATVSFMETGNSSSEGYFNYNLIKGVHSIDAVLGAGYYVASGKTLVAQSAGFFTDSFLTDKLQSGATVSKRFTGSSRNENTKLSQFGRFSYTYKDKYTLVGTLRRDGSSYFADNHKWGIFPSISGAWRISEEDWMQLEWLNNLKVRAGYGTSGNEPNSANSLSVYAAEDRTGGGAVVAYGLITDGGYLGGVQLNTVANPNLKWETDKTLNFGLDYGLFKQRVGGSIDYFIRTAVDLLDYKWLPSNGLVDQVIANVGSTEAKGWEFLVNTINISKPNFGWQTDINLSYTRYRWKTRNPELVLNSWVPVDAEMSASYGWETAGIFKSYEEIGEYVNGNDEMYQPKAMPGNIKYVDYNGDGVLDDKDNHFLGVRDAPWRFGLNNTFSYKNLSLSFYFYGAAGHVRGRGDGATLLGATTGQANGWSDNVDRYWTQFNPDGDWPGLGSDFTSQENRTGGGNDFWNMKGDFLKLQYATLNYNLPNNIVGRIGLGTLGVSLTAQNLMTITGYKGYDPEVSVNSYPLVNSFTLAVKATF